MAFDSERHAIVGGTWPVIEEQRIKPIDDRREQIERGVDQIVARRRAFDLQSIAFQVLKSRYPALAAAEWNHDGGKDAFLLPADGETPGVSLACSMTATLSKVRKDCKRIQDRGVHPRLLVFVTPRVVERTTIDKWKAAVTRDFGHDLEEFARDANQGRTRLASEAAARLTPWRSDIHFREQLRSRTRQSRCGTSR